MKDASQYPITTGYGYIAGYPLNNGFHKGEDRAMPVGTPVLVNGVQIGLSGNTGASTGPHLHIGKFINGVVQPPNGAGFSLANASVFDTGSDATNGNFVRVTTNGELFVYLHLSRIDVIKGQILKGDDMETFKDTNDVRVNGFGLFGIDFAGYSPEDMAKVLLAHVGESKLAFYKNISPTVRNNLAAKDKAIADLQAQLANTNAGFLPYSGAQLYIKRG